jgi:hypothetical protein
MRLRLIRLLIVSLHGSGDENTARPLSQAKLSSRILDMKGTISLPGPTWREHNAADVSIRSILRIDRRTVAELLLEGITWLMAGAYHRLSDFFTTLFL